MVNENNEDAASLLLTKYYPIIRSLAKHYYAIGKNYGLELDDFIQEGNYALFYATKKYTEEKNSIFYTYSILCIKSRMQKLLVRSSTNRNNVLNNSISLNQEISEDSELIDYIVDDNAMLPEKIMVSREKEKRIMSFLYKLPIEYASIFELKMNGFTNHDIKLLLDRKQDTIRKALNSIRKNLKLYIEKIKI